MLWEIRLAPGPAFHIKIESWWHPNICLWGMWYSAPMIMIHELKDYLWLNDFFLVVEKQHTMSYHWYKLWKSLWKNSALWWSQVPKNLSQGKTISFTFNWSNGCLIDSIWEPLLIIHDHIRQQALIFPIPFLLLYSIDFHRLIHYIIPLL